MLSGHESDQDTTFVDGHLNYDDNIVAHAANKIRSLRKEIDDVDVSIVTLLARRFAATDQVGVLKAEAGFAPADPNREQQQIEHLRELAQEIGLDPAIAEAYHAFVAGLAKERHTATAHKLSAR